MVHGKFGKVLTYASTTAVKLGELPPNAVIHTINVNVAVAGNASGNDYVQIGTADSASRYAANVDVSSTGKASVTHTAYTGLVESTTGSTAIYAIYEPGGTAATAGSFSVVVEYCEV